MAERLLRGLPEDYAVCSLRYFNPLGAHPSGRLGDAGGANVITAFAKTRGKNQGVR